MRFFAGLGSVPKTHQSYNCNPHYDLNQSFQHGLGFGLHLILVLNFKKPISLMLKPGIANLGLKILFSVLGFRASILREALILLKLCMTD